MTQMLMHSLLQMARQVQFVVIIIVLAMLVCCRAQWEIQEDIPLGSTQVIYKPFKDAWVVSFDTSTSEIHDRHTTIVHVKLPCHDIELHESQLR